MNLGRKKILHIIQSLSNGGCENMLLRTLPLLSNFDHKIITLKELGELAPKFMSTGIAVETVHRNNLFDIAGIMRLRKLVQEEKPDIIITYLFHADMIGRFFIQRKVDIPIIPFLRTTYNHPKYLVARVLEWLTRPLVSQYLANSDAVKDFYVKHICVRPEKITVIPNGIDIEYFDYITPDPELRKSLNINSDDFVIICVANLHQNKGHSYLLESFESLQASNLKLLLVGEGEEKQNLEQQIKNYRSKENIFFLGRRTDVPQLLRLSNLFVLPTLFEGMSNAILEAMAVGLPIITTDIPENTIWISHRETALLVQPRSSKLFADAIIEIIRDKQLSFFLGSNAKKFVAKKFGLSSIANQWKANLLS